MQKFKINSNRTSKDFSLTVYKELLQTAIKSGFRFYSIKDFLSEGSSEQKEIMLRHDVDKKPKNSLLTAKLEADLGITSTYYFRCVPKSYDEKIIKEIAELGHELGYHYEDLSLAKGDYKIAIKSFDENLTDLRKFYPVKTICMHGSPLSKWDNKKLWAKYNYKDFGIIAEPYLDINFNEVFYLTDTGRSWNHSKASIRDKVNTNFDFNFKSTFEIIDAIGKCDVPNKIMIHTHPQRWSDNIIEWIFELITQSAKNIIKQIIIKNAKQSGT